jgi:hypothetical protein
MRVLPTKGVLMRRGAVLGWVFVIVLAWASAAGAAASPLNRETSGLLNGTTVFDFSPSCTFFGQTYDATYVTSRGDAGTLHVEGCAIANNIPPGFQFGFEGTFVLTTPNGSTLTGTVRGGTNPTSSSTCPAHTVAAATVDLTLVPTSGTRFLRHADGTVGLDGVWCSPAVPAVPGPVTGALTGALS